MIVFILAYGVSSQAIIDPYREFRAKCYKTFWALNFVLLPVAIDIKLFPA
jgi:hypothetical protein